jgi:hypothetical protein
MNEFLVGGDDGTVEQEKDRPAENAGASAVFR